MGRAPQPQPGEDVDRFAEAIARLGERRLTWPELCERAGVDHSTADPLWRALGFPDVPPDEPVYTHDDVRALQIAAEGLERLDEDDRDRALEFIVREARTVSAHLARIADAQVDALAELEQLRLRETARNQALEIGLERSDLGWLLMYGLRRRLDEAIRRRALLESAGEPELVVGFVDLVDFTRTSTGLDAAEFGRLLSRFEALAWDEVTEAGGQLVKLIGDEAMFVAPPSAQAAEAALAILSQCGQQDLPPARAGLALGPVLIRGGDYFGNVVNLASRLVDAADPGTVAVDEAFREQAGDRAELNFEPLGERHLKGIGKAEVWKASAPA
jgi:adenylate cyclase